MTVMFCCNHSRNGVFLGRVSAVSIDDVISLDGPNEDDDEVTGATEFAADRYTVALGGVGVYPHSGYREWVGNWCWDSARMAPAVVVRLLNDLRRAGWDCHEAETGLFEKWRSGAEITLADMKAAISSDGGRASRE